MNKSITLLDCTLRDGGYINDWKWGFESARKIIRLLSRAKIEIVEVGFLRNVDSYSQDITVCNHIEELNRLLPDEEIDNIQYSGMVMRSNYNLSKLCDYSGKGISIIRVTAHENDIFEGLEFASEVQKRGYKVSINPINIMGYDDNNLLHILDKVNKIHPWQFSIVDTFGSMKRRDLDRIVSLVDHNLDKDIRVAMHLHENMAQSFSLAQVFVDKHLDRPTALDGSLQGMGRTPGNLPIELIADYLNEYFGKTYDIDFLLDAIQDHISIIKGDSKWGYNPAYFLSAKYNLHRNYAEFYLNKGDLIARDINRILSRYDHGKAAVFDLDYAERMYMEYIDNQIDDRENVEKLKKELTGKSVLILAPGHSIKKCKNKIQEYINKHKSILIAVNFDFKDYNADYVFYGNNRRYNQAGTIRCKTIATSNVKGNFDYYISRNRVSGAYKQGNNSLVMLLTLLHDIGCSSVALAGADGFENDKLNYFKESISSISEHKENHNIDVAYAIKRTGVNVKFITRSKYEEEF